MTNHDLLFALELAEVWYDQSWPWICISPAPRRPRFHSGRGTTPIYASVEHQTMMVMNSRSLLPRLLLPTYNRMHLATLPKDTRLWICAHGRIIRTLRYKLPWFTCIWQSQKRYSCRFCIQHLASCHLLLHDCFEDEITLCHLTLSPHFSRDSVHSTSRLCLLYDNLGNCVVVHVQWIGQMDTYRQRWSSKS